MLNTVNALNVFWAVISLTLGVYVYRASFAVAGKRLRKITAILLGAVCLFPSVSVCDDLVRFASLNSLADTRSRAGAPTGDDSDSQSSQVQLAQLLDSLDAVQLSAPFQLCAAFAESELSARLEVRPAELHTVFRSGRAPPVA